MNTQRLMARYSTKYGAGVTAVLDSREFARLREDIITSHRDRAVGTLEQAGISESIIEAISQENARLAQTSDVRNDPKFFVAALDKRLSAIEEMLLKLGQRMDASFASS